MTAYTEKSGIHINVSPNGVVEVRTDTVTLRDGVEIARVPHRVALAPGDDVSGQPDRVRSICLAVWTPEITAAYAATLPEGGVWGPSASASS